MHDFLLAKEILDELEKIAEEKKLKNIKKVKIAIGQITMAHDGYPEHMEDISVENLNFGLVNISQNTDFKNTFFEIKKIAGDSWKITNIEVE